MTANTAKQTQTAQDFLIECADRFVQNGGTPVEFSLVGPDGLSLTFLVAVVDATAPEQTTH